MATDTMCLCFCRLIARPVSSLFFQMYVWMFHIYICPLSTPGTCTIHMYSCSPRVPWIVRKKVLGNSATMIPVKSSDDTCKAISGIIAACFNAHFSSLTVWADLKSSFRTPEASFFLSIKRVVVVDTSSLLSLSLLLGYFTYYPSTVFLRPPPG